MHSFNVHESTVISRKDFEFPSTVTNDDELTICTESQTGNCHLETCLELTDHLSLI